MSRALAVGGAVALALFVILSANITLGQEDLEVGQIAERDIRSPRNVTFESVTQTRAAREAAADDVPPQTVTDRAPADNLALQLSDFDSLNRAVTRALSLRDRGDLTAEEVVDRLVTDAQAVPMRHRDFVSTMPAAAWDTVSVEARRVLEATLTDSIRQDELTEVRDEVRSAITVDLTPVPPAGFTMRSSQK